jgi:hypothetical protein
MGEGVQFGFIALTGSLKALSGLLASAENGAFNLDELGWLVSLVSEKADHVFELVKRGGESRALAA